MNSLKILKSKTFWLNIIGLGLMIANDQVLGKMIPTEYAATTLAVLNIINRFLTTKSISEK